MYTRLTVHSPLAIRIRTLFFRDRIRKYGGKGLMSFIDSLTSSNPGEEVATDLSPETLGDWSCFSVSFTDIRSLLDSYAVIVDLLEL